MRKRQTFNRRLILIQLVLGGSMLVAMILGIMRALPLKMALSVFLTCISGIMGIEISKAFIHGGLRTRGGLISKSESPIRFYGSLLMLTLLFCGVPLTMLAGLLLSETQSQEMNVER